MPSKTFFTYEQQIDKLKKEKQLVISDTEFAKDTLQKLSYDLQVMRSDHSTTTCEGIV